MDCIALRGTVSESMRKEFIMEVSIKEYKLWQEGKLDYIVNSWNFNLSQAVEKEVLQPLGIMKIEEEKKRENYYLCDKFLITLPEDFVAIKERDTIYSLLQKYMEGNMELFRQLNSIENPNLIFPGQQFVFPNLKKWRERPKNIDSNLLSEGCLRAKDTGRESVTVYLEPKEISLKDLEESFPARENCQILAKALQEDRIEEVLKELHQPPRNILSEEEKYLWETRDTVTWYLKDFRRDKEGSSLQEEVWYYFKEEERAYEQITIATVDKKTGFPLYHIMNMLKRPDGNYYVSEPWKAFSVDKGHYFIPSQGRYGQSDLWVPVKDFYGNIKGVAGYFDSDNVIIYMEKIDDTREESSIRIFRQYITRRYLLKEEQKLPYFMERELN